MKASEQDCLDLIARIEVIFPRAMNGYDVFPDDNGHAIFMVCNDDPTDDLKAKLGVLLTPDWKADWAFFEHGRWRCRIVSI